MVRAHGHTYTAPATSYVLDNKRSMHLHHQTILLQIYTLPSSLSLLLLLTIFWHCLSLYSLQNLLLLPTTNRCKFQDTKKSRSWPWGGWKKKTVQLFLISLVVWLSQCVCHSCLLQTRNFFSFHVLEYIMYTLACICVTCLCGSGQPSTG